MDATGMAHGSVDALAAGMAGITLRADGAATRETTAAVAAAAAEPVAPSPAAALEAVFGAAAHAVLGVTATAAAAGSDAAPPLVRHSTGGGITWWHPPPPTSWTPPPTSPPALPPNVLVVGPSQAGKSYLLRAGAAASARSCGAACAYIDGADAVHALDPGNAVGALHRALAPALAVHAASGVRVVVAFNDIDALFPAAAAAAAGAAPSGADDSSGVRPTERGEALGATAPPRAAATARGIHNAAAAADADTVDAARAFLRAARTHAGWLRLLATAGSVARLHPLAAAAFSVTAAVGVPPPSHAPAALGACLAAAGMRRHALPPDAIAALATDACAGFLVGDMAAVACAAVAACDALAAATAAPVATAAVVARCAAAHTPALVASGGGAAGYALPRPPAARDDAREEVPTDLRGVTLLLPAGRDADARVDGRLRRAVGAPAAAGADAQADDDDARAGALPIPAAVAALLRVASPGVPLSAVHGQAAAKAALAAALGLTAGASDWAAPPAAAAAAAPLPRGVLLYGPPGTGKTLLAKAAATALGARFLAVSIPAILRAGVGESERALAAAFGLAAAAAPCVVFMDELQALFVSRPAGAGGDESSRWAASLTSQLLLSMDAVAATDAGAGGGARRVTVLAATNVPEALDTALLRAGRLDRVVYVGLPDAYERTDHYAAHLERLRAAGMLAPDVAVAATAAALAAATDGCSYADCTNVVRAALVAALPSAAAASVGVSGSQLAAAARGMPRSVPPARLAELAAWGASRR